MDSMPTLLPTLTDLSPPQPPQVRLSTKAPKTTRRVLTRAAKKPSVNAVGIEQEISIDEAPLTLLREGGEDDADSMRARFEKMIRAAQDEIVSAVEELDGKKFQEDAW